MSKSDESNSINLLKRLVKELNIIPDGSYTCIVANERKLLTLPID